MRMPLDHGQCAMRKKWSCLGCMFGVFACTQASAEGPYGLPERRTAHGYARRCMKMVFKVCIIPFPLPQEAHEAA